MAYRIKCNTYFSVECIPLIDIERDYPNLRHASERVRRT
jgi:hypothetical protein